MDGCAGVSFARVAGRWAWDLVDSTSDLRALDGSGAWVVVLPYAGEPTLLRFARWGVDQPDGLAHGVWRGPAAGAWRSSMDEDLYCEQVERTREAIGAGTVYQANICRVLSAPIPDPARACVAGLGALLHQGNPAPYGGFVHAPQAGVQLATASPELFLERTGDRLRTGPIKGTASSAAELLDKDRAENLMIVDLMRNDLSVVCEVGSVAVPSLMRVEEHPGLVHLVSTVEGVLRADMGWPDLLRSSFPPGSVTGAPKSSAVRLIDQLEPVSREVYCGAIGWVDASARRACLAVAIRTFWIRDEVLRFGTGAGITWGSDPMGEWRETELKARRLISLAAGSWDAPPPQGRPDDRKGRLGR